MKMFVILVCLFFGLAYLGLAIYWTVRAFQESQPSTIINCPSLKVGFTPNQPLEIVGQGHIEPMTVEQYERHNQGLPPRTLTVIGKTGRTSKGAGLVSILTVTTEGDIILRGKKIAHDTELAAILTGYIKTSEEVSNE